MVSLNWSVIRRGETQERKHHFLEESRSTDWSEGVIPYILPFLTVECVFKTRNMPSNTNEGRVSVKGHPALPKVNRSIDLGPANVSQQHARPRTGGFVLVLTSTDGPGQCSGEAVTQ